MSHGCAWRGACASTIRDKRSRWLWRLVGPGFDCVHGVFFYRRKISAAIPNNAELYFRGIHIRSRQTNLVSSQTHEMQIRAPKKFFTHPAI
jgi:hypothetical protein